MLKNSGGFRKQDFELLSLVKDPMKIRICEVMIISMLLGSAGCASLDYVRDAPERVKSTDWSKMKTISISLTEYAFSPSTLVLQQDVPYKLEIMNKGMLKHYFTALEFFKSIATRKVQSNTDGEIKAPYFTALEVFPGRSLDLYFIPVKKGRYELKCTIKGHAEKGMVGQIKVE